MVTREPWRVYLAGRISPHESDWRKSIIDDVATRGVEDDWNEDNTDPRLWQWTPRAAKIDGAIITGPFFIEGEGHDGMHGPDLHGVGVNAQYQGPLPADRRKAVLNLCMRAIERADTVLVWLEDDWAEAYGTLAEIGFAYSKGMPVHIGSRKPLPGDLWLIGEMAHSIGVYSSPVEMLRTVTE